MLRANTLMSQIYIISLFLNQQVMEVRQWTQICQNHHQHVITRIIHQAKDNLQELGDQRYIMNLVVTDIIILIEKVTGYISQKELGLARRARVAREKSANGPKGAQQASCRAVAGKSQGPVRANGEISYFITCGSL